MNHYQEQKLKNKVEGENRVISAAKALIPEVKKILENFKGKKILLQNGLLSLNLREAMKPLIDEKVQKWNSKPYHVGLSCSYGNVIRLNIKVMVSQDGIANYFEDSFALAKIEKQVLTEIREDYDLRLFEFEGVRNSIECAEKAANAFEEERKKIPGRFVPDYLLRI